MLIASKNMNMKHWMHLCLRNMARDARPEKCSKFWKWKMCLWSPSGHWRLHQPVFRDLWQRLFHIEGQFPRPNELSPPHLGGDGHGHLRQYKSCGKRPAQNQDFWPFLIQIDFNPLGGPNTEIYRGANSTSGDSNGLKLVIDTEAYDHGYAAAAGYHH